MHPRNYLVTLPSFEQHETYSLLVDTVRGLVWLKRRRVRAQEIGVVVCIHPFILILKSLPYLYFAYAHHICTYAHANAHDRPDGAADVGFDVYGATPVLHLQ